MNNSSVIWEEDGRLMPQPIIIVIVVLTIISLITFCIFWKKRNWLERLFWGLISITLLIISTSSIYSIHYDLKCFEKYKNGDYLVIEGQIDTYDSYEVNSIVHDVFTVSDVEFLIPNTSIFGYNFRKIDGSILVTGMNVRIYYIPYKFENIIMKIEKMEPNG
ncbi:MAG: hypothetical protein IKS28_06435 [Clostridia bacterium]|nr:hypothetical protein [Clostridia bacterium]